VSALAYTQHSDANTSSHAWPLGDAQTTSNTFLVGDTNRGKSNSFWLKLLPSCITSCYAGSHEAFCQARRSDDRYISGSSPNGTGRESTLPPVRRKRTRPDSSISWTCITSSRAHEPVASDLNGTRHSNASSHRADKEEKTNRLKLRSRLLEQYFHWFELS
jgi:hypothetical protein